MSRTEKRDYIKEQSKYIQTTDGHYNAGRSPQFSLITHIRQVITSWWTWLRSERWLSFTISLTFGYVCFLRAGFASLAEWDWVIRKVSCWEIPRLRLDYGMWTGRWYFIHVRPFRATFEQQFSFSCAVHFLVKLRASEWPCCGQKHSIIRILTGGIVSS
jgi:hypothetical protein